MRAPKKGTVLRAAFDAAHAYWCGTDCSSRCREWPSNVDVLRAVVDAVRRYDQEERDRRFEAVLARELANGPRPTIRDDRPHE